MRKRKAMIMAAGKGTRLLPYTDTLPKALMKYKGRVLLELVIERLKSFQFNDIIINIHHFPEMIIKYLKDNNNFGVNIYFSDETDELLETGGGLKKASWFFDSEPFLVHNVDILADIDLDSLLSRHLSNHTLATLAVMERETTRPLLMDMENQLCGWKNLITGEEVISRKTNTYTQVGFSGIYILDPEIFSMMNETASFSITPVLLRLAKEHNISLFLHDGEWMDLGRIDNYDS